ncbi:DEAD/DEAH box helicase [Xanthocytophaga agilis]|uniref:DEAD/DEAH box helicase family protein n=1 Tax=Xanthocytophaga agilis TaxID=3048010 RepID=A0AAE3R8K9_9BACT|nr:DEAD/DEAH box helicase family protein [Xanthocytophaga agilis]MDJ1502777.1 DEAD/DEAH box helicase family protein [Xanthocytophaga agilis]
MTHTDFLDHVSGVDGEALPNITPALQLRDYQEYSITELMKRHQSGIRRVILCLPTGAGKTVTFAELTRRTLASTPHARVLILTDRIELLYQAAATLERAGMQAGILRAGCKSMPDQRVIVAMVETYHRRLEKGWSIPDLHLIIIDEAHKGNFRKVLEFHEHTPMVGATATPLSSSKQAPLNTYFEDIVVGTYILSLIEAGYLALPRYFAVPVQLQAGKGLDGDYNTSELYADFNKPALYKGCVANWYKHALGKKTLIFCVNILHTLRTAQAFAEVHEQVRFVNSDTPEEERKAILQWFALTPDAILVNCGILTTGFDEPTVECIVLNRATRSLPLYLQMCGRGSRTTATKKEFIIIDMGNNIRELGFWHDPRDWKCIFLNSKEANLEVAPVKTCPACESLIALTTAQCPYCGYVFEQASGEVKVSHQEAVTQEIVIDWSYLMQKPWDQMNVTELLMRAQMGNPGTQKQSYKVSWIINCILNHDNPRPMLEEFARLRGYHPRWVDHRLAEHKAKQESMEHGGF